MADIAAIAPAVLAVQAAEYDAGQWLSAPIAPGVRRIERPDFECQRATQVVGGTGVFDGLDLEADFVTRKLGADLAEKAWLHKADGLHECGTVFQRIEKTAVARNKGEGKGVFAVAGGRQQRSRAAQAQQAASIGLQQAERQFGNLELVVGPQLQRPFLTVQRGFIAENLGIQMREVTVDAVAVRVSEAGNSGIRAGVGEVDSHGKAACNPVERTRIIGAAFSQFFTAKRVYFSAQNWCGVLIWCAFQGH